MSNIVIKKKLTEYDKRVLADRDSRRQMDRLKGLSKAKGAQFGDFKMCREVEKEYSDYRRFKDSTDREKIKQNITEIEKAQKDKVRRK